MNHHPGLCDAQAANALHPPEPAPRRFFYARLALAAAGVLLAALVLTGCDKLSAAHAMAVEKVAEQQDREALSSREWAGQQVCGPKATAVWLNDKTLECLRTRPLAQGTAQ